MSVPIGNYQLLGLFVVLAVWSYIRFYIDPSVLLQDLGNFGVVSSSQDERKWRDQSRVSCIIMHVTRSPGASIWMWAFVFIAILALVFSMGTVTYQSSGNADPNDVPYGYYEQDGFLFWAPINLTTRGDFAYPPQDTMQYPTCRLFKGFDFPSGNSTALADYTFLATMIYQAPETLQGTLDEWFGPGVGTVEVDLTKEFRQNVSGGATAVNYNFVSFSNSSLGVVLVRGSTTAWVSRSARKHLESLYCNSRLNCI